MASSILTNVLVGSTVIIPILQRGKPRLREAKPLNWCLGQDTSKLLDTISSVYNREDAMQGTGDLGEEWVAVVRPPEISNSRKDGGREG